MTTWRIIVATGLRHACILLAVIATLAFSAEIHVHQVATGSADTCHTDHGHAHGATVAEPGDDDELKTTPCGHCDCSVAGSLLPTAWTNLVRAVANQDHGRPVDDQALPGLSHPPEPPPVLG